jgi:phosphatidylglycerol:prolipoprotein diacylglycerol transferase
MRPTVLSIGIFDFHAYTVGIAIAFLVCVLLVMKQNYKLEKPYPITPIVGLWAFFGAFVGARAYHIAQYGELQNLYRAVFIWEPGLVYYGGLLGGIVGCIVYLKLLRVPLLPIGDLALPYLALGGAIVRIGCFLNGCCWGPPTTMPWGVTFPLQSYAHVQHIQDGLIESAAEGPLPVHPTQLYNTLGLLLVFFVMRFVYKRLWKDGRLPEKRDLGVVMMMYPLLYGVSRFTTEAFRGDSARSIYTLTVSQAVSLGLFLTGFAYFVWWAISNRNSEVLEEGKHAPEDA